MTHQPGALEAIWTPENLFVLIHPMSSVTQNWLRQNTTAYAHPEPVFAHILNLLLLFPTIRPKSDVYSASMLRLQSIANSPWIAFDDGRTQLLLCVHGLLPISFRNASYNIPIAVWITRDYPKQPPITFVVPTNDMLVKPGKYLDVSGRCNIDYLQHWERKDEVQYLSFITSHLLTSIYITHKGCNLSALFEALREHFSRDPPVYSKPKEYMQSSKYADKPPPPLPPNSQASISSPTPFVPTKPPSIIASMSSLQHQEPQRSTNVV